MPNSLIVKDLLDQRHKSKEAFQVLNTIFYGCPVPDDVGEIVSQIDVFECETLRSFVKFEKIKDRRLFFLCLNSELVVRERVRSVLASGIELNKILENEDYCFFLKSESGVIDEFITRSFDVAYCEAQKFKNSDSRANFMRRYFKSFKQHEGQLCSDNIQRLKALEMMIELNGVEPPKTLALTIQ